MRRVSRSTSPCSPPVWLEFRGASFLAPGNDFVEDSFSSDQEWVGMVSG